MTDKDYYHNKISQAFMNIGKEVPDDDSICLYKSGALDSYDMIQLILEIEMLLDISIDLDTFAEGELSLLESLNYSTTVEKLTSPKAIWNRFLAIVKGDPKSIAIIESKTGRKINLMNSKVKSCIGRKFLKFKHKFCCFFGQLKIEHVGIPLACATGKCFVPLNCAESAGKLKDI